MNRRRRKEVELSLSQIWTTLINERMEEMSSRRKIACDYASEVN